MIKIILVANNYKIPPVDFRKEAQITDKDIIVRVGKSFLVPGDRTDLYFIRCQKAGYTGVNRQTWRIKPEIQTYPQVKYFAINASPLIEKILRFNNFKFDKIVSSAPCAQKYRLLCPSSGLVVLEYLLENYPAPKYQIYINNFSWEGWKGHDWEKENQIFGEYLRQKRILVFTPSPILKSPNPVSVVTPKRPSQEPIPKRPFQKPTEEKIIRGGRRYRIPNGSFRPKKH